MEERRRGNKKDWRGEEVGKKKGKEEELEWGGGKRKGKGREKEQTWERK